MNGPSTLLVTFSKPNMSYKEKKNEYIKITKLVH